MATRMATDIAQVRNRLRPSNCGSRSRMRIERVLDDVLQELGTGACPMGQRPPQAAQERIAQVRQGGLLAWARAAQMCQPGLVVSVHGFLARYSPRSR